MMVRREKGKPKGSIKSKMSKLGGVNIAKLAARLMNI
jgi:hypothetical protein